MRWRVVGMACWRWCLRVGFKLFGRMGCSWFCGCEEMKRGRRRVKFCEIFLYVYESKSLVVKSLVCVCVCGEECVE